MKNLSKQALLDMVLTKEQQSKIDFAIPFAWSIKCKEIGIDPQYYVWSYLDDRVGGKPFNLLEAIAKKYESTRYRIGAKLYPSFKENTKQILLFETEDLEVG